MVIESIARDPRLKLLEERLAATRGVVHLSGLWGSSAPLVTAYVAANQPRTFLYVTAHLDQADNARDDLECFAQQRCSLLPAWEALPGEGVASGEIQAERLQLCARLLEMGRKPESRDRSLLIVAGIQALMQPVPAPAALQRNTLQLVAGSPISTHGVCSPEDVLAWAVDRGYERLDLVESPGDVARRGDILDLFVLGETHPYRFQFLDDTVESIRRFDPSVQRSFDVVPSLSLSALPARPTGSDAETTDFFSYLSADALLVLDGPSEIQEMGEIIRARLNPSEKDPNLAIDGPRTTSRAKVRVSGPSGCSSDSNRLFHVTDVLAAASGFGQLHLSRFGSASIDGEDSFDLKVTSCSRFEGGAAEAIEELIEVAKQHEVHVFCDNDGEQRRLKEMLVEQSPQAASAIKFPIGTIHRGFEWTATRTVVIAHHELFHRQQQRRRVRKLHAGRPLDSWLDLKPGERVVHVVHGIAIYRGLQKMRKGESSQQEEFLTLEFADRALVHVPSSQIDMVQQYIGTGGRKPALSVLGGKRWGRAKERAAESVTQMAESLLRVQAVRRSAPGIAYPADTEWQREFEAAFLYEETEDQTIVADEIRGDLTQPQPMDRLVCGDVGYGKTELAMRAAFKVVEYGRQVAVLVPTTVLAQQHYRTFTERMAEYPFSLGCLSRFNQPAEQRKLIEKTKKGQIDILVGTHRLLSKDISFRNLGLVIIDEEQRFGVEHKERLKSMRETVDVLTLTATPIPRTLHMALVGIRDISSLQTPPVDRRAIATQVRPFDRKLIRDAILREMNRDGQTYFIHNFVQSIAATAAEIQGIVPEARVVFAHGQMKDGALENVMCQLLERKIDVLVATTIIENGIDIPTVNTIFIDRAERFGLSDLHQLRGRVGRSSHRAYCYLLLSPNRPMTPKAVKRLKTIEEFSELGAGFRIAMRDLEIRGAGNLLGREQSGHIAAVGYEMFCRLLNQTISRLSHEPDPTPPPVHVDLGVAAHIPPHYIKSDRARIEIYRRVVACRTGEDLVQLERDLADAFGPLPQPVEQLLQLTEIRVHARSFGVQSISLRHPDVVFRVEQLALAEPLFIDAPGTVRMPDARTVYLRLSTDYLEPRTLLPILRNLLVKATSRLEAPV